MSWLEQIEELTKSNNHLSYSENLLQRKDLQESVRSELNWKVSRIRKRASDSDLYLAIVGRASTGKSTFINALLGEELLTAGITQMTTSAATMIRYGKELEVEVYLALDEQPADSTPVDEEYVNILHPDFAPGDLTTWHFSASSGPISIPGLPDIQNMEVHEFIEFITTSPELEHKVAGVTIRHPASFLEAGVTLIDTPGADAENEYHKEVTRTAVSFADAAVIVTPSTQVVSRWLLNWMREPDLLQPFLHRCLFIVTAADRISKKNDLEAIHQHTIRQLREGLDLSFDPVVYLTAAQAVVDTFSKDEPVVAPKDRDYWCDAFSELTENLYDHIIQQRANAIAESILRLLDNLFQVMGDHLSLLWNNYEHERAMLEEVVEDIKVFGKEQMEKCDAMFASAKESARDSVRTAVVEQNENTLEKLEEELDAISFLDDLKEFPETTVEKQLATAVKSVKKSMKKHHKELQTLANRFNSEFENEFKAIYTKLELISHAPIKNIGSGLKKLKPLDVESITPEPVSEESSKGKMIAGGAIGAVIGQAMIPIPVVGAAIGGWLGSRAGKYIGQPSLTSRKEQFWNQLRPAINSYFEKLRTKAMDVAEKDVVRVVGSLHQQIDTYKSTYEEEISKTRALQNGERTRIENMQAEIQKILSDLDGRRQEVKQLKEKLQ